MSNSLHVKGASPGPVWSTLQAAEGISSDENIDAPGISSPPKEKLKKRKGAGDLDVVSHDEVGPSNKRPRHTNSASSLKLNTSNQRPKFGFGASFAPNLASHSGANAAKPSTAPSSPKFSSRVGPILRGSSNTRPPKPFRSVTQPVPVSTLPSISDNESTASRIAAAWNLAASSRGGDPIGEKQKNKYKDHVKPAEKEGDSETQYRGATRDGGGGKEKAREKGKGKERAIEGTEETSILELSGDPSDGNTSSSAGPVRTVRIASAEKPQRGTSHLTPRNSLVHPGSLRNAEGKGDRGPLIVNNQRQVARKSVGSSRPPKRFLFDRQLTPSSNGSISGTDSSSPTNTSESNESQADYDQEMEDMLGVPRVPTYLRRIYPRKSTGGTRPSNNIPTSPIRPIRLIEPQADRDQVMEGNTFQEDTLGVPKPPTHFRRIYPRKSTAGTRPSNVLSTSLIRPIHPIQPRADYHQVMEEDTPKVPTRRSTVRKESDLPRPSRLPLTSSIKGKEKEHKVTKSKLQIQDDEEDIIIIESSEGESAGSRPVQPQKNQNQPSKGSLAGPLPPAGTESAKIKERKMMPSGQLNRMNLIDALNKAYQKEVKSGPALPSKKALEDDIIDLTLDDSDEATPQARINTTEPSSPEKAKQEYISPPRLLSSQQSPGLAQSPSTLFASPIRVPKSLKEPRRPRSATNPTVRSSRRGSDSRLQTVPAVSALKLDLDTQRSETARPSGSILSAAPPESPPIRRARAGRILQSEDHSDSEGFDPDQIMDEASRSPRRAQSSASSDFAVPSLSDPDASHALPEVIPPLRRSLRRSSGSSHSETDNFPAFTDAESPPDSSPSPGPDDVNTTPSYGGFKALTWEHHKKNLRNFQFKHYFAKDIPTSLPDSVNRLSEYTRMNRGMQDVFRAFILENIVEEEAGSPDIEIINDIDLEPTPLFEFYYSNKMWYGENVPFPDYNKLKGCDCVGGCDPKSRTCSCAVRQRSFLDMDDGFVYEKNGRLKHHRYPIFECNDLCACESDCRNRVVQNGRKCQINIRKTRDKGWGVFNGAKRIPRGTFIGIYAGELLTDDQSEFRGRYYNKIGKTYLFDIDFWHLKSGEDPDEWRNKYVVDAYHAGNFTRFLNHSCDPNARLYACYITEPDIEKPLLVVFSTRDIEPHEEICFNYQGNYPEDGADEEEEMNGERQKRDDPVYTECKCGARNCTGAMFQ